MERITISLAKKLDVLRTNSYFSGLPEAVLEEMAEGMRLCRYAPGEVVFWDQEPCSGLHILHSGSVKLFKLSPNGREFVLQSFEAGATFNEVPVFDNGPNPVNVAALEECEIWIIDAQIIRTGLENHPELAISVITNLTHNLRMLVGKIEELSFYQVTHRLARLIEQLPPENLEGKANQRLTHDQIAARLGTVREVVGRSLRELERSGAIKVSRGRIKVVNTEILQNWTGALYN